jgi:hypothetical protein
MNHRSSEVSSGLTAFLGGAVLLAFWTVHYGLTWPNRDSYAYFYYLDLARTGHLGDLIFARNNEHLVAFHYAFALAILQLFDVNTKIIVFANATLLLASGLMTYLAVRGTASTRVAYLALPVLIVVSLMNPSQTSYLLWEYQLWFYIDLALLAANALLVERFGFRAYPAVALFCLLATGSQAPGSFLWLAAGIQFFYVGLSAKSRAGAKAGSLILAIHVCAFLAATWLLLHGKYGAPLPRQEDAGLLGGLVGHIRYGITIIGGGYGIRSPNIAFVLGALSFAAWCVGTALAVRERFATALFRVAFVTGGIGLLWGAAFAAGRESLGIPWALGDFHASPLLIPFYTGVGLYAAAFLQYSKSSKWIGGFLALICIAPSFAAIPYGHERSVEMKLNSLLAASVECGNGNFPPYLRLRLNGLEGNPPLYGEIARYRTELCAHQPSLATASDLLKLPARYAELAGKNPRVEDALRTLWYVYLTHVDLHEHFPVFSPSYAENLLKWAVEDAKTGSMYENEILSPYASVYEQLGPLVGLQ